MQSDAVSKIQNEHEKMIAIRGDDTVATAQVLGVVLLASCGCVLASSIHLLVW